MKNAHPVAVLAAALAFAGLASTGAVHAQSGLDSNHSPAQPQEPNPAKRLPAAPAMAPSSTEEAAISAAGTATPYAEEPVADGSQAGFFVGAQVGKGWVYEDVEQSAYAVNAGYRWQVGPVGLVGVEVGGGRLAGTEQDGWSFSRIDYRSVGANARFNFGRTSPVYALVRGGYWAATDRDLDADVDGGYFGVGVGVDFNRHFSMNLTYTSHVYFEDYYWEDDEFYYDINSADTLMLGAEARF